MSFLYNAIKFIVMLFEPNAWDEFCFLDKIFRF